MDGPKEPDLPVSWVCHVDSGFGHAPCFDKQLMSERKANTGWTIGLPCWSTIACEAMTIDNM